MLRLKCTKSPVFTEVVTVLRVKCPLDVYTSQTTPIGPMLPISPIALNLPRLAPNCTQLHPIAPILEGAAGPRCSAFDARRWFFETGFIQAPAAQSPRSIRSVL